MTKKQELTPENSFFKRDSVVLMSGADYAIINQALDEVIGNSTKRFIKHVNKFIDKDGEPVELKDVTQEKVESGEIRVIMDIAKTMNPNQLHLGYDSSTITPTVMEAKRVLWTILQRASVNGETFPHADIDKEEEEYQRKMEDSTPILK